MVPTPTPATVAFQLQTRYLVVPGILVLIGSYLAYAGLDRIRTQRRAVERFEPVEARVTVSDLGARGREGNSRTYFPDIEYEYEYDGEAYVADTAFPGGNFGSRDEEGVRQLVDSYNVGETVTAYVDPDDPADAYLVEGELGSAWTFVGAGALLVVVALGVVWYATTL